MPGPRVAGAQPAATSPKIESTSARRGRWRAGSARPTMSADELDEAALTERFFVKPFLISRDAHQCLAVLGPHRNHETPADFQLFEQRPRHLWRRRRHQDAV